jgi:sugar phosphate permease
LPLGEGMSVSVTILIIIILVQLIVGLFKLENVNIRKSKTEISGKNNLKLFAVLFTTLSAFCYLLSHHVSGSYPEISNVALILAGSLLTTGIFSILIGFPIS